MSARAKLAAIPWAGSNISRQRRKTETPFTVMWECVDRAVSDIVDHTTFADLLRSWAEKQNKYVLNWEI